MFCVETDAISADIQAFAREELDRQLEIFRSGRLGSEVKLPQAEAERLADRLRRSGHEALCGHRDHARAWQARR